MAMTRNALLAVDGAVNLGLGVFLIWFPPEVVASLGLPASPNRFYPTILGGVLFGVGLALLAERHKPARPARGLGVVGAACINLSGGLILVLWLLVGHLDLPMHGTALLWGAGGCFGGVERR